MEIDSKLRIINQYVNIYVCVSFWSRVSEAAGSWLESPRKPGTHKLMMSSKWQKKMCQKFERQKEFILLQCMSKVKIASPKTLSTMKCCEQYLLWLLCRYALLCIFLETGYQFSVHYPNMNWFLRSDKVWLIHCVKQQLMNNWCT